MRPVPPRRFRDPVRRMEGCRMIPRGPPTLCSSPSCSRSSAGKAFAADGARWLGEVCLWSIGERGNSVRSALRGAWGDEGGCTWLIARYGMEIARVHPSCDRTAGVVSLRMMEGKDTGDERLGRQSQRESERGLGRREAGGRPGNQRLGHGRRGAGGRGEGEGPGRRRQGEGRRGGSQGQGEEGLIARIARRPGRSPACFRASGHGRDAPTRRGVPSWRRPAPRCERTRDAGHVPDARRRAPAQPPSPPSAGPCRR